MGETQTTNGKANAMDNELQHCESLLKNNTNQLNQSRRRSLRYQNDHKEAKLLRKKLTLSNVKGKFKTIVLSYFIIFKIVGVQVKPVKISDNNLEFEPPEILNLDNIKSIETILDMAKVQELQKITKEEHDNSYI